MARNLGPPGPLVPRLKVMDMGLDFRSYGAFVDASNQSILGNTMEYELHQVTEDFEPTVGLLVTLLQMYHRCHTHPEAKAILNTYRQVQSIVSGFTESRKPEIVRYANDAIGAVDTAPQSSAGPDSKLAEKLLIYLDGQSGLRGGQSPSSRAVPQNPKGTFCNLYLGDKKCHQEFSCNQLHLKHRPNQMVQHRVDYHLRLIDALLTRGIQLSEVQHRVKDSLFYARYGNRVTVLYKGQWIPFFKTIFSSDRLAHALRVLPTTTPPNILVQQERNMQPSKMMDLQNPRDVIAEIEMETATLFQLFEGQRTPQTASVTQSPEVGSPAAGSSASDTSMNTPQSPTGEGWSTAVRNYMRENNTTAKVADQALLSQLQGVCHPSGNTPVTPETFTPLLREVDMMRFDSATSLDNDAEAEYES